MLQASEVFKENVVCPAWVSDVRCLECLKCLAGFDNTTCMNSNAQAYLDWLAGLVLLVDLIKDDAIVLVPLGHVSSHCEVNELPKLFQDDLSQPMSLFEEL